MYVPTTEQFFSKEDKTKPDIAFLKNHFYREGRLTEEQALYILEKWVGPAQRCGYKLIVSGAGRYYEPSRICWRSMRRLLVSNR